MSSSKTHIYIYIYIYIYVVNSDRAKRDAMLRGGAFGESGWSGAVKKLVQSGRYLGHGTNTRLPFT